MVVPEAPGNEVEESVAVEPAGAVTIVQRLARSTWNDAAHELSASAAVPVRSFPALVPTEVETGGIEAVTRFAPHGEVVNLPVVRPVVLPRASVSCTPIR